MPDDRAADEQPPRKKRKRRQKQKKRLHIPQHIAEAGYRYLSVALVGGGLALCGVTASGIFFNFVPIWLIFAWLLASAGAWVVGARRRIGYVQEHGNDNQLTQVRAEFWGTLAYGISLIVSFILLFIIYWYMMPVIGSSPGAGVVAAIVTIVFFLVAYWLSYKNRQRVYENFGYAPDDATLLQQTTHKDSPNLQDAESEDAETDAFVQGLDKLDKSSNAN
jgi:hypothetical protein